MNKLMTLLSVLVLLFLAIAETSAATIRSCWYDVTGEWRVAQENGPNVLFKVSQPNGYEVVGTAYFQPLGTGQVHGSYQRMNNIFYVKVYWPGNKSIGAYTGMIKADGHLAGSTTDVKGGTSKISLNVKWRSTSPMKRITAPPCRPPS